MPIPKLTNSPVALKQALEKARAPDSPEGATISKNELTMAVEKDSRLTDKGEYQMSSAGHAALMQLNPAHLSPQGKTLLGRYQDVYGQPNHKFQALARNTVPSLESMRMSEIPEAAVKHGLAEIIERDLALSRLPQEAKDRLVDQLMTPGTPTEVYVEAALERVVLPSGGAGSGGPSAATVSALEDLRYSEIPYPAWKAEMMTLVNADAVLKDLSAAQKGKLLKQLGSSQDPASAVIQQILGSSAPAPAHQAPSARTLAALEDLRYSEIPYAAWKAEMMTLVNADAVLKDLSAAQKDKLLEQLGTSQDSASAVIQQLQGAAAPTSAPQAPSARTLDRLEATRFTEPPYAVWENQMLEILNGDHAFDGLSRAAKIDLAVQLAQATSQSVAEVVSASLASTDSDH